jgi:hypothetical protein
MILIIMAFMLATLVVLVTGILLMAKGGKVNEKYSNRLMIARVVLQAMAVLLLGLMYFVKH